VGVKIQLQLPLTLALGGGKWPASCHRHFTPLPGRDPTVPVEWKTVWASKPVRMFWRKEKSVASNGMRTPDHPVHRLVNILIMLYWFPHSI